MLDKYGTDETKNRKDVPSAQPVSQEIVDSGLMGKWETILLTGDNNTNGKLDPEERTNASTHYKDYLELHPDGTCVYSIAKLNANYEIVEKDGNKSIEVIVADGSRLKQGRIISLLPDELQLMKFSGGRDIVVYKRI